MLPSVFQMTKFFLPPLPPDFFYSAIQRLYVKSTNVSELSIHAFHNSSFIFILYTTLAGGAKIL
jgi:hypothetical protein